MYCIRLMVFIALIPLLSCNWAKEKTKATVNKTGEVVAKTGSEFVDGMSKGIEKTFQQSVSFSEILKQQGIQTGKIIISGTDSTTDNIISAYLIFDKDVELPITIKIFSQQNLEYGRVTQTVKGHKGEARFVDFIFDKRTNLNGKDKLVIQ